MRDIVPTDWAEAPAVDADRLDPFLAGRHPLGPELARLRIDQLLPVLDAFDALAAPHRRVRGEPGGPGHDFAIVLDAMRAEVRAALATRRLDPVRRAEDARSAAFEAHVLAAYDDLEATLASAALDWLEGFAARHDPL